MQDVQQEYSFAAPEFGVRDCGGGGGGVFTTTQTVGGEVEWLQLWCSFTKTTCCLGSVGGLEMHRVHVSKRRWGEQMRSVLQGAGK